MNTNKYSTITLRVTDEEKEKLEQEAFMKCVSISDILRQGLKLILKDNEAFETTQEKRGRLWNSI